MRLLLALVAVSWVMVGVAVSPVSGAMSLVYQGNTGTKDGSSSGQDFFDTLYPDVNTYSFDLSAVTGTNLTMVVIWLTDADSLDLEPKREICPGSPASTGYPKWDGQSLTMVGWWPDGDNVHCMAVLTAPHAVSGNLTFVTACTGAYNPYETYPGLWTIGDDPETCGGVIVVYVFDGGCQDAAKIVRDFKTSFFSGGGAGSASVTLDSVADGMAVDFYYQINPSTVGRSFGSGQTSTGYYAGVNYTSMHGYTTYKPVTSATTAMSASWTSNVSENGVAQAAVSLTPANSAYCGDVASGPAHRRFRRGHL